MYVDKITHMTPNFTFLGLVLASRWDSRVRAGGPEGKEKGIMTFVFIIVGIVSFVAIAFRFAPGPRPENLRRSRCGLTTAPGASGLPTGR
jgi:hypothetical protein